MLNKIVVQYFNKLILKDASIDFFPSKQVLHITDYQSHEVHSIKIPDLKAIFFVKDFSGDKDYKEKQDVERIGFIKRKRLSLKIKSYLQDIPHVFHLIGTVFISSHAILKVITIGFLS